MHIDILGKKLLTIVAHPDDESFLAAGTLYANKLQGGSNYLICASKGERGYSYMETSVSTEEMKELRRKEFLDASSYVGVDAVSILDFRDGELSSSVEYLEKEVKEFADSRDFDFVLSFGPDGYTGHTDHVAVYHVAKDIANMYKVPLVKFSKLPKGVCKNMDTYLATKRLNGTYDDRCPLSQKPDIHIKIDPAVKFKALSFHKSQFKGLDPYNVFPKDVAEHFLSNEYFHLSEN
ncbi:MAG: PIG-L deacetylase family protein [Patescibacteria group bacterium]